MMLVTASLDLGRSFEDPILDLAIILVAVVQVTITLLTVSERTIFSDGQ